jgi:hypothetical protein
MMRLAVLVLLVGCAAPHGVKATNPVCVRHCVATSVEAGPGVQQLNTRQDYRSEARLF